MYFSKLVTCYAVVVPLSRRRAALPVLVTLPIKAAANEGERQKTKMFIPAALLEFSPRLFPLQRGCLI